MADDAAITARSVLIAIFLPPLGVFLKFGCECQFWIVSSLPGLCECPHSAARCFLRACRWNQLWRTLPGSSCQAGGLSSAMLSDSVLLFCAVPPAHTMRLCARNHLRPVCHWHGELSSMVVSYVAQTYLLHAHMQRAEEHPDLLLLPQACKTQAHDFCRSTMKGTSHAFHLWCTAGRTAGCPPA